LDLTDERGQLAGRMLAMLGADVVLVEPPGGSSVRSLPPFAADQAGTDRSLMFWGWNRGKRSIVLDLTAAAGQDELRSLVRRCDVVIESSAVPVDVADLRRQNPELVTVSISAFGSTGPKADWPATDLTVLAAGGQLVLTGDADRPPVRTSVAQAFQHAAGDAACGALVALSEREKSGQGQHVDVSAQRSVLMATQSHVLAAPYRSSLFHRMSGGHSIAGIDIQLVWPCQDGYMVVVLLFGPSFGPYTARLVHWLHEEGHVSEDIANEDWISYGGRLFSGKVPVAHYEQLKEAVAKHCANTTKEDLLAAALDRRLLVAPIATTTELAASPQLQARHLFEDVLDEVVSPRPIRVPGRFVRLAGLAPDRSRAPRIDEHRAEVVRDWGARPPRAVAATRHAALDGLRVVDLTWALSGPATARFLSDFGATVIHVESACRVDSARTVQPFLDDDSRGDNAAVYHNMNVGKLSLSLNLSSPEGRAVLDDLVRWADVLIESLSPRAAESLGLDYERLASINPMLIMMSSCLFGHDGPLSAYAGFGNMASAITGFYEITGWPDRAPAGPFSAYTDYVSPRFAIGAILHALEARREHGHGQYLDFAQAEAAIHFLLPALLDATVNGRATVRFGNDDAVMAPHGVYPCAGEDRWVAIACRDDRDWQALAAVVGCEGLMTMPVDQRRSRCRELDLAISAWTSSRAPTEAEAALVARGVPAHSVQHSPECAADPQLQHIRHFVEVDHPYHGRVTAEASRVDLEATPSRLQSGAPILGLHTDHVLAAVLGYDDDRIGGLYAAGALD
jgi:crotonobetainyl-CoA:carnitine CoA-transferase CaiB-like acyl-CoA transferase